MISEYKSETGIDKWIRRNVFKDNTYKGILVEVGAATPDYISNSYHFRVNGWRTISIEPNPYFVQLHKNVGSEVYEFACSDVDKDNVPFIIVGEDRGKSNLSFHSFSHLKDNSLLDKSIKDSWKKTYDNNKKNEILVNIRKLDTILENLNIDKIDILTIDVEGNEDKVLNGFNILKYEPKVIVLENINNHFDFKSYLKKFNYEHKTTLHAYDQIFVLKNK